MKKFSENLPIWVFCWKSSLGICNDCGCILSNIPCKKFVDLRSKIFRYRHYHKTKPKFPTTLDAWKKREKLNFQTNNKQDYGKGI